MNYLLYTWLIIFNFCFYLVIAVPGGISGKASCSLIPYIMIKDYKGILDALLKSQQQRYFWDNKTKKCEKVMIPRFGVKTSNFYNILQECEDSCKDDQKLLKNQNFDPRTECVKPAILATNPEIRCFAPFEGWTYNSETKLCENIIYSCGDIISNNLFKDEEICIDTCRLYTLFL